MMYGKMDLLHSVSENDHPCSIGENGMFKLKKAVTETSLCKIEYRRLLEKYILINLKTYPK